MYSYYPEDANARNAARTCVNDVASLTENGTSSTLANVRARSVLPGHKHQFTALVDMRWPYPILSAHCIIDSVILTLLQNIRSLYITKTLLFSNRGSACRCCMGKRGGVRRWGCGCICAGLTPKRTITLFSYVCCIQHCWDTPSEELTAVQSCASG